MISEKMQNAINDQINAELESAYIYLSMSAYFEAGNYRGFARWMRLQSEEEKGHADRLFNYLVDRGGRVILKELPAPKSDFKSPEEVYQITLDHERKITAKINKLNELAAAEKDHATVAHLQWFVTEQVEEEATAEGILNQIRMVESKPGSLFYIDRHIGKRGKE